MRHNLVGALVGGSPEEMPEALKIISGLTKEVKSVRVFLTYSALVGSVHPLQREEYDDHLWKLLVETCLTEV